MMRWLAAVVVSILASQPASAQERIYDTEQHLVGPGTLVFQMGDVDANGTLDVVTMNGAVTRTDGQGHFGPPDASTTLPGGNVQAMLVTDVSGDGRADLVVAIDGLQSQGYPGWVVVNISDGQGHFASSTAYLINPNAYPWGLAAGDIDLDGDVDIVTSEYLTGLLAILPGTGGGAFGPVLHSPLPVPVSFLHLDDVNGDGLLDLLSRGGLSQVSIWPGNGTLAFGTPSSIPIGGGPGVNEGRFLVADLNEDGKRDLVLPNFDGTLETRLANGQGGFGPPVVSPLGSGATGAVLGDLDLDGHLDLVSRIPVVGLIVCRGNGQGGFAAPVPYAIGGIFGGYALADFDGDGDLDAIVGTHPSRVRVLRGDGLGAFLDATLVQSTTNQSASNLVLRDFDSDGKPDAVVTVGSSSVNLLPGNGASGFGPPSPVLLNQNFGPLAAADLDGNGQHDLLIVRYGPSQTSPATLLGLLGNGAGGFSQAATATLAPQPSAIAVLDVDLNGTSDVLVANGPAATISLVRGNGTGGFGTVSTYSAGASVYSLAAGDIDGDGWPDVVHLGAGTPLVMRGNGTGGLSGPVTIPLGMANPGSVWLSDVDGDTHLDLISGPANKAGFVIWAGTGAGGFGPPRPMRTDGVLSRLAMADVNADGLPDLCFNMVNVPGISIAFGTGGGQFGAPRSFGMGYAPTSLGLVDVDLDGMLDLVATNAGGGGTTNGSVTLLRNRLRDPLLPKPLCFGNGAASACPCGNSGGPARGCGNSVVPGGARLLGSGATKISNDSFRLECRDYPTGAGLYFRGDATIAGGLGAPIGDGLACAGGTIVRIAVVPAASGQGFAQSSIYPGPADPPISLQSQATPGTTLVYQLLYRDPSPAFCTLATFNTSNAVASTWVP